MLITTCKTVVEEVVDVRGADQSIYTISDSRGSGGLPEAVAILVFMIHISKFAIIIIGTV